jgi:hypothetical protein
VGEEVGHQFGGIAGLRQLLDEHKGAINYDLQHIGKSVWDVGRTFGWSDFKDFVEWLPPTGDSALFRARNPQSWWVTPEVRSLTAVIHVLSLANWQRAGGKKAGPAPKPMNLPEDKPVSVKSGAELLEKRRSQAEHLKRRRAQANRERR